MQIKRDLCKATLLVIILSIFYYVFHAWNENTLNTYCQKYICFEILSFAEFLALLTAWISLYFVLKSLESWKDSYKFQRAIEAMKKVYELKPISDQYLSILYKLSNQLKKTKEHDLKSSFYLEEKEYDEKFDDLDIYKKILDFEYWLDLDKNIKYYNNFKKLLNEFNTMIMSAQTSIKEAHLSESNYGSNDANEIDILRRKASIKKVQLAFEKYKLDRQAFHKSFQKIYEKLNEE